MDLISFVNQNAATTVDTESATANLAEDFDTFLTLLTAQLENQDPLDPVESAEFTDQLVQFSQVEQQIQSNDSLAELISATQSSAGAALSGYLGRTAEINRDIQGYAGEPVSWRYTLASDAESANVTVFNASGQVVYSQAAETTAGSHVFDWNGETLTGETATDGAYSIVVTADGDTGDVIDTSARVLALVTGVDLSSAEPAITTPTGVYSYSDITRLIEPVN